MNLFVLLTSAAMFTIWSIAGEATTAVLWLVVAGLMAILIEVREIRKTVVPEVKDVPHEQ